MYIGVGVLFTITWPPSAATGAITAAASAFLVLY